MSQGCHVVLTVISLQNSKIIFKTKTKVYKLENLNLFFYNYLKFKTVFYVEL